MKILRTIIACSLLAIIESQNLDAGPFQSKATSAIETTPLKETNITQPIRLQDLPLETRRYICEFLQPKPGEYTQLQKAVTGGYSNINNIRTLLACGFNPNVTAPLRSQHDMCLETSLCKIAGSSDIAYNQKSMRQRCIVAKLLLHHGADIQQTNEFQESPLHGAVTAQNIPMIQLLIQFGARLDAQDCLHQTPLDLAKKQAMRHQFKIYVREKYYEICALLEQLGAPSSLFLEPMPTDEIMEEQARIAAEAERYSHIFDDFAGSGTR